MKKQYNFFMTIECEVEGDNDVEDSDAMDQIAIETINNFQDIFSESDAYVILVNEIVIHPIIDLH